MMKILSIILMSLAIGGAIVGSYYVKYRLPSLFLDIPKVEYKNNPPQPTSSEPKEDMAPKKTTKKEESKKISQSKEPAASSLAPAPSQSEPAKVEPAPLSPYNPSNGVIPPSSPEQPASSNPPTNGNGNANVASNEGQTLNLIPQGPSPTFKRGDKDVRIATFLLVSNQKEDIVLMSFKFSNPNVNPYRIEFCKGSTCEDVTFSENGKMYKADGQKTVNIYGDIPDTASEGSFSPKLSISGSLSFSQTGITATAEGPIVTIE